MTNLIFVGTCDFSGKVRGKAFPAKQLDKRLVRGVGWTPTNVQITCFDEIADSPFGAFGDLLLVPDAKAGFTAQFGDRTERFMLGNIITLEGEPWDFCTRALLVSALDRLYSLSRVRLLTAFEHEFQLKGESSLIGEGYGRLGFEIQRPFCEKLMDQISEAGLIPDSIMKEYGPNQYEVVIRPEVGVHGADAAVIVRELVRSTALYFGEFATFSPILDPASVGNGVHIHMSFLDDLDQPVAFDSEGPCGMSELTASFAAGILKYLNRILSLTAPSAISSLRLQPHRWSAAYNNLGFRDREASLRICPVTKRDQASIAQQFNIEYRAVDAAASPHLALAAIIHAGCQGIEDGLVAPSPTDEDLSLLSVEDLATRHLIRLPESLEAALDHTVNSPIVSSWFPEQFIPVYAAHKATEIAHVAAMDTSARCSAYAKTY